MTRLSQTMTPRCRHGFTLIEILVVAAIIGMMAAMVMPKGIFSFTTPMRSMQRAVIEAADIAADGFSIRLRMEAGGSDRGRLVAEALTKTGESFGQRPALEWTETLLPSLPEGEAWRLEPGIVYFYSDGTCTPASVTYAEEGVRLTDGDFALLTVTGFLFEPEMAAR